MSTGYTHAIKDGITFKEYAMSCARAFGALIRMREEPSDAEIPEKFEPSDYHTKRLVELNDELKEKSRWADTRWAQYNIEQNEKREKDRNKDIAERIELKKKYEDMLAQVNAYVSPSNDHDSFKEFMKKQIEESIPWDCSTSYYDGVETEKTWKDEKKEVMSELKRSISYHEKEELKEIHRTNENNLWLSQLRKSLL